MPAALTPRWLRVGERRVFIADGEGGHQRLIPVSPRFFAEVSAYVEAEPPAGIATGKVFVVLEGLRRPPPAWPRRGARRHPLPFVAHSPAWPPLPP
jgi:hypothetical protein